MNLLSFKKILFLFCFSILFFSCQKENHLISLESNDGIQARLFYTEKGYNELEIIPIIKKKCYFSKWDKEIMTPVSGMFEYYDFDDNLVASIHFGDGECDEWATKTWDTNIFPDYPEGTSTFSVFEYNGKGYKDKQ